MKEFQGVTALRGSPPRGLYNNRDLMMPVSCAKLPQAKTMLLLFVALKALCGKSFKVRKSVRLVWWLAPFYWRSYKTFTEWLDLIA